MNAPHNSMLDAALEYAVRLEWYVFPARISGKDKMSFTSGRFTNGLRWGMTKDPEELAKVYQRWRQAGIGIPTGSENNIFVVDIDTADGHGVDGFASLRALEAEHGPLPLTLMAQSPSGSVHYYFRPSRGVLIKNSTSEIAPGIDIRGEGGMVVAPPSEKPGKGRYAWLNQAEIADAPAWLIEQVRKPEVAKRHPSKMAAARKSVVPDSRTYDPVALAEMVSDSGKGISTNPNDNYFPDIERTKLSCRAIPNPDLGWDDWNTIAMATWQASDGSTEGLAILHSWSRKSTKYDPAETDNRWATITTCPPTRFNGKAKLIALARLADRDWERCNPRLKIWAALARLPFDEKYQLTVGCAARAELGAAGYDLYADWGGSGWQSCTDGPGHCGDVIYRLADEHDPTWRLLYRRMLDAQVQQ